MHNLYVCRKTMTIHPKPVSRRKKNYPKKTLLEKLSSFRKQQK
jgi:hypothetical protein